MNPAVLLIDMQEYFLRQHYDEAKEMLVASQLNVLSYCAKTDVPVIIVECEIYGRTIDILLEKAKSIPRVKQVSKCDDSAFHHKSEPHPSRLLEELSIDYLVLMGVNADSCVQRTAWDALSAGYKLCTSADLIADQKSFLKYKQRQSPLDWALSYVGISRDPETIKDCEQYKFLTPFAIRLYKERSDFFNCHKKLIAHLEESRKLEVSQ